MTKDVFFFEAFAEEAAELRRLLPAGLATSDTPGGAVIAPVEQSSAGPVFDLLPGNGRYEILT